MKKMLLARFLIILLFAHCASAELTSKILAKVNSTYISQHDLSEAIMVTSLLNHLPEDDFKGQENIILKDLLVKDILIITQGKKLGITPSVEEVNTAIDTMLSHTELSIADITKIKATKFINTKVEAELTTSRIMNSLRSQVKIDAIDLGAYGAKIKIIDKAKLLLLSVEEQRINEFVQLLNDGKFPLSCSKAEVFLEHNKIAQSTIMDTSFAELNPLMQKLLETTAIGHISMPLSEPDSNNATFILVCNKIMKDPKTLPPAFVRSEVEQKKLEQVWHKYFNMLKKNAFIEYAH